MQKFAFKTAINGLALWLAAVVLSDVRLGEDAPALGTRLLTILLVAIVFGAVNALLKPLVKLLSLPFVVLTLGLFTIVVNAIMLELTAAVCGALGLDFHVDTFFWGAVLAALIISFVSMLLSTLVPDDRPLFAATAPRRLR